MVDRSWDKDLEDMGSKCCLPPPLMDVAQVSQGLLIPFVLPGFRQSPGVEGMCGEHQRLEALPGLLITSLNHSNLLLPSSYLLLPPLTSLPPSCKHLVISLDSPG